VDQAISHATYNPPNSQTKLVLRKLPARPVDMADKNAAAAVMKPATRAYVTLLANDGADDDSFKGVVGLAKGLRNAGSAYPLVVAVLPDVPESHRRILVSQGCIVREIEPVYPPENQTQFAMAYYVINYSKLRIWEVLSPTTTEIDP